MKNLALFFIGLLCSSYSYSQWSWQNPKPQGDELKSMYFTSANTGIIVGNIGRILKTTDGGSTWTFRSCPINDDVLVSVCFTDNNNGYAAGGLGTLLKTSDGGDTWIKMPDPDLTFINEFFFTDANTGFLVGQRWADFYVLKTSNG